MATPPFPSPVLPFPSPLTCLIAADVLDTNIYTVLHDTHPYTHIRAHFTHHSTRRVPRYGQDPPRISLVCRLIYRVVLFFRFGNVLSYIIEASILFIIHTATTTTYDFAAILMEVTMEHPPLTTTHLPSHRK